MNVSWFNMIRDSDAGSYDTGGRVIQIGKDSSNDIVLDNPVVAEHAIVLEKSDDGWQVVVLDGNSIDVGGEELYRTERRPLGDGSQIRLFPYLLTVSEKGAAIKGRTSQDEMDERMWALLRRVHRDLLEDDEGLLENIYSLLEGRKKSAEDREAQKKLKDQMLVLENDIESFARRDNLLQERQRKLLDHIAAQSVRSALLSELVVTSKQAAEGPLVQESDWSVLQSTHPGREEELQKILDHIRKSLKIRNDLDLSEKIDLVSRGYWQAWETISSKTQPEFQEYLALRFLKRQIKDILFGFGPLEDLLRIPSISEIMVVSTDKIYVERDGVLEITGRRFISDAVTESIISRIVGRVSRRIDRSQPLVDARLEDGSRVNAVIKPLAVSGPCLTIRKFPYRRMTVDDLVKKRAITRTVADFLRAAVINRRNILVAGGTGTGKTTLLNCLSEFIPDKERIITVEDTAELRLSKEHAVRLETKTANVEGAGAYEIRDLVKNALRMRPDRIIVGECRGAEALDMLQAMNTGHDGSLTTIHANTPPDVILRLEVLVQMAADLPIVSIHRQIASAINLIVQLRRFSSGRRCVSHVTEVVGMNSEGTGLLLRDLFLLDEAAADSDEIRPTGHLPTFMDELLERKLLNLNLFYGSSPAMAP